jgi:hypothetical protein
MSHAENLTEEWRLSNEILDLLEGRAKDALFDFMMSLAIELANLGYSINADWEWHFDEAA